MKKEHTKEPITDLSNEIWVPIEEYPNYYISNCGRVKSRHNNILKLEQNEYLAISLGKGENRKFNKIHKLVAKYFVPNPNNLPQINHKDENKYNNHHTNLEWCTQKENMDHSSKTRGRNGGSKIPVVIVDNDNNIIESFPSKISLARKYGVCSTTIQRVFNGFQRTYKGNRLMTLKDYEKNYQPFFEIKNS